MVPETGTTFMAATRTIAKLRLMIFEKYRQKYRHLTMCLDFDTEV